MYFPTCILMRRTIFVEMCAADFADHRTLQIIGYLEGSDACAGRGRFCRRI